MNNFNETVSKESFIDWNLHGIKVDSSDLKFDAGTLKLTCFKPVHESKNHAIIFIAGWISQMETWREVLTGLSQKYPLYYLETREKVSSQMSKQARYGVSDIAKDIVALVDKLKLKSNSYILMGSSLGATAIVESFQYLESKPQSVILINPNAEYRVPLTWKIVVTLFYPPLYLMLLPIVKWYLRIFRLNVDADPEQFRKYASALDGADPWKLKKAVLALSGYSIWKSLKYMTCPALIVGASKDKLHEPQHLQRMVEEIDTTKIVDLKTNKAAHGQALIDEVNKYLNIIAE